MSQHKGNFLSKQKKDKGGYEVKIQEIREIAKVWNINTKIGRSKKDIIHDIQISEGNSPCFRTKDTCENNCLWKNDCVNHE